MSSTDIWSKGASKTDVVLLGQIDKLYLKRPLHGSRRLGDYL